MFKMALDYLFILMRLLLGGWGQTAVENRSPEAISPTAPPYPSRTEERLIAFMDAWKDDQLDEMAVLLSPSWASAHRDPYNELFYIIANRTPLEYEIESISGTDEDNSRIVTITASIDKNDNKAPQRYRFMIVMSKEDGEWYIDPRSLATNDVIATPIPTTTQTPPVPTSTQTPRTTVTPVPPAEMKLYYNPNGGSYYHTNPECPSVHPAYLPLQGSFLYQDLKEYQELLLPCLTCNAPVYPLPE